MHDGSRATASVAAEGAVAATLRFSDSRRPRISRDRGIAATLGWPPAGDLRRRIRSLSLAAPRDDDGGGAQLREIRRRARCNAIALPSPRDRRGAADGLAGDRPRRLWP